MNNIAKILISLMILLTGCSSKIPMITNNSLDWKMEKLNNYTVKMTNLEYPNIYVDLNFGATLYAIGLTRSNCEDKYKYGIGKYNIEVAYGNSARVNHYSYFIKPNKSNIIKQDTPYIVKINNPFETHKNYEDKYYNISEYINKKGFFYTQYASPLICGELENAEFVMDGLAISKGDNTQPIPLAPIKLRFNFDNPQSIPLYGK